MDATETKLAGVTLRLHHDANANQALDGGDQLRATRVTGADGAYVFGELPTADYIVELDELTVPVGAQRTTLLSRLPLKVEGGVAQDTGSAPTEITNQNFGYKRLVISGYVFEDLNSDGAYTVLVDGVAPGAVVSLYRDVNNNGRLEFGVDTPESFAISAPTGAYALGRFSSAASFLVRIERGTLPPGLQVLTTGNSPTAFSEATLNTQCEFTVDFGFRRGGAVGATISDFVWRDLDSDGLQDVGEPGVPHFAAALFDGTGTNLLATTSTDLSGLYEFTGLSAGTYIVEFGGVLPGQSFTLRDLGTDDTKDSDPDPATRRTAVITLAAGERNTTVDAGIVGAIPVILLDAVTREAGDMPRLRWVSTLGFDYQLQFTPVLGTSWQSVGTVIAGTGSEISYAHTLRPGESHGFFRIFAIAR